MQPGAYRLGLLRERLGLLRVGHGGALRGETVVQGDAAAAATGGQVASELAGQRARDRREGSP